jgi:hypothetical protein
MAADLKERSMTKGGYTLPHPQRPDACAQATDGIRSDQDVVQPEGRGVTQGSCRCQRCRQNNMVERSAQRLHGKVGQPKANFCQGLRNSVMVGCFYPSLAARQAYSAVQLTGG